MTSVNIHEQHTGEEDREPKLYPQFILFGDSITQGANADLVSQLSDYYLRRLDVINRGFSGYTAPMGLAILPRFFPAATSSMVSGGFAGFGHVRLMTVFFGANDACLPGQLQHVPLATYTDSLRKIASHEGVRLNSTKIIFITPPPLDEYQQVSGARSAENTARYAAACRDVAASLRVPCVDLWRLIMTKAGWNGDDNSDSKSLIGSRDRERSQVLDELLEDGLHLSSAGYQVLWQELKAVIEKEVPSEVPDRLPMVYPGWMDVLQPDR